MITLKKILKSIYFFLVIISIIVSASHTLSFPISEVFQPSSRYSHQMVFDEGNERIILYGGAAQSEGMNDRHSNETWIFKSATESWNRVPTKLSPGLIAHHSMAYDSVHEKVVCFGGLTEAGDLIGSTWIFDCNTDEWVEMQPVNTPPPRSDASLYFDTNNEKVILMGGYKGASQYYSNDLWEYDIITNNWTQLHSLNVPPASYGHQMIYHASTQQGILFGGRTSAGVHNDVWFYHYANKSWITLDQNMKPITRYWHTMTYNTTTQQVIIFGGRESEYINTDVLNDTWVYDISQNSWTEIQTSSIPPSSSGEMVYDTINQVIVLFGGVSSIRPLKFLNGTWIFNSYQNKWNNVNSSVSNTQSIGIPFESLFFLIPTFCVYFKLIQKWNCKNRYDR